MSSPAEIIYQLLLDLGHGSATEESGGWLLFVCFLPDLPDSAICVYDTAGKPDGRLMVSGKRIEHQGILIRVKGQIYSEVWAKTNEIALALDDQRRISVAISSEEEYLVHNISRTGTIISLGIEEIGDRRSHNFTINAVVTISEADADFRETEDGDFRILE